MSALGVRRGKAAFFSGCTDVSPAYVRRACQSSLKRLQTDWIDLYQLHVGDLPVEQAGAVADTLDELCDEGLIRHYGWSTDDQERAAVFGNPDAVRMGRSRGRSTALAVTARMVRSSASMGTSGAGCVRFHEG